MAIEIEETLDDFGSPIIYIKDLEKNKATYSVYKGRNGFSFFEVGVSVGTVPVGLRGQYTSQKDAERAVVRHLERTNKSKTVRRDENAADFRKKKEARKEEDA